MANVDFDSVNVGDEIPELVVTLDQMMLWMYSGASLDYNPIHNDKDFGEKVGLGGTIAHGLSSMGRQGRALTDWLGDPGRLKKLKIRMSAPAKPGDTLTFWGKVREKKEEDGKKLVVLDVGCKNQDGAEILSRGEAVVEL